MSLGSLEEEEAVSPRFRRLRNAFAIKNTRGHVLRPLFEDVDDAEDPAFAPVLLPDESFLRRRLYMGNRPRSDEDSRAEEAANDPSAVGGEVTIGEVDMLTCLDSTLELTGLQSATKLEASLLPTSDVTIFSMSTPGAFTTKRFLKVVIFGVQRFT